jgi:hypothetical protein
MTTTQLAELFLLRLYDTAEANGHNTQLLLNDIAREFGVTDTMKVKNVADFLEGHGLIRGIHTAGGHVRATITGEGSVYVEGGGQTGVIREYRQHPENYRISIDQSTHFHGSISDSNIAVRSSEVSQGSVLPTQLEALLSDIAAAIRADTGLSERHRNDYLADLETLRSELQRKEPRKSIVNTLISQFANMSSITSLGMQLWQYLPAIQGLNG